MMVGEARGSWFKKRVSRVGRSREAKNWPSYLRMALVMLNLFLSWPVLAFRKEEVEKWVAGSTYLYVTKWIDH
jgi:hypothetical protein